MNQSAILIDALLNGKTLEKNCAAPASGFYDRRYMIQTLSCETYDTGHKHFYVWGWGSAFGRVEDRIMEVLNAPERWQIAAEEGK